MEWPLQQSANYISIIGKNFMLGHAGVIDRLSLPSRHCIFHRCCMEIFVRSDLVNIIFISSQNTRDVFVGLMNSWSAYSYRKLVSIQIKQK